MLWLHRRFAIRQQRNEQLALLLIKKEVAKVNETINKDWISSFIRWSWFGVFFHNYEWYRKLYGGLWAHVHVDEPCYSCMWLNCPDGADETYREWNWRGTPNFRYYKEINSKNNDTKDT